jgi:hydroxymethylglutaryl-CoA lyase
MPLDAELAASVARSADQIYPRDRISLREVGLRDGLQLVKTFPTHEAKERWIGIDHAAGVRHFEAGSYLPADRFPQFADVDDLVDAVARLPGAWSSVLVLNLRGAERALAGRADEITAVISASEAHNLANVRRTREQGLAEFRQILALRAGQAHRPLVSLAIPMSFGCSISGPVVIDEVVRLAAAGAEAGADLIGLADTVGYAGPRQVRDVIHAVRREVGELPICLHLHDTRGMGIANAAAALDEGIRVLDGSLAGLGGCPFAPKATGNVVLEDLAFLCQTMGFPVPIDIDTLVTAREVLAEAMPDEKLYGALAKAGLPLGFERVAAR